MSMQKHQLIKEYEWDQTQYIAHAISKYSTIDWDCIQVAMNFFRPIMKYILFLLYSNSDLISDTLQLNMNTVNTCKQKTCLSLLYKDYHKPVKF